MAPIAKKKTKKTKTEEIVEEPAQKVVSAQLQKKLNKTQKALQKRQRGVVLLRHLPKGFFEEQLKNYFSQFGDVTRVRLARSRQTGGSKSFAFVEFKVPEVAQIAAETMDNYLMFQKLVKAHYIPPEKQQYDYFRTKVRAVINNHGKTIFTSRKMVGKAKKVKRYNNWNENAYTRRVNKTLQKLEKFKKKYGGSGLDIDSMAVMPTMVELPPQDNTVVETDPNTSIESNEEKTGNLLLVKKRKAAANGKGNKEKKSKKPLLKQLLEDTIQDSDSQDEDYLPVEDYDPDATLETPPTLGFAQALSKKLTKKLKEVNSDDSESDDSFHPNEESNEDDDEDSDLVSDDDNSDEDMSEDEEEEVVVETKKKEKQPKKSKFEKDDRLEKIIRRKQHSGSVFKKNQKPKLEKAASKTKLTNKKLTKLGKMQKSLATELVKESKSKPVKKNSLKMKKSIK